MIPTMAFIHFLTGKSSGILSDISSGILSEKSIATDAGLLGFPTAMAPPTRAYWSSGSCRQAP